MSEGEEEPNALQSEPHRNKRCKRQQQPRSGHPVVPTDDRCSVPKYQSDGIEDGDGTEGVEGRCLPGHPEETNSIRCDPIRDQVRVETDSCDDHGMSEGKYGEEVAIEGKREEWNEEEGAKNAVRPSAMMRVMFQAKKMRQRTIYIWNHCNDSTVYDVDLRERETPRNSAVKGHGKILGRCGPSERFSMSDKLRLRQT